MKRDTVANLTLQSQVKQADKEEQLLKKHAMKQLVALLKVYSDIFTQSQRDMGSTDV